MRLLLLKILIFIFMLIFIAGECFALPQTKIYSVAPIKNHKLVKPFKITASLTGGKCWSSVAMPGRSDALRCMVGNEIYDPCFQVDSQHAFCLSAPWELKGVLIKSTQQDVSPPQKNVLPWAVQLATGIRCVVMTGATFGIQDERVNYACDDGSYLVGEFDKAKAVWQIKQLKLKNVAVKAVWC